MIMFFFASVDFPLTDLFYVARLTCCDTRTCTQCGIYNYDVDERCARCSTRPRDTSRYCSMSRGDRPDEERDIKKPEEPKWPPPFESGGAAYDFHPGSGMFFEARANFFYDPKTKLYYGNRQKLYYTYSPEQDPPFCALGTQPTSGEAASVDTAAGPKPEEKKKIAISLKTTTLPGEKATKKPKAHKAPKKVKAAPPEPKKQDAANIEVWAERGKEIRDETAKNVTMTTTNKPVCLLCRRKFASVEKLKKHEEVSALHKENLEKKRKEDEAKGRERESRSDYRDRAFERRIMHGPEAASLPALPRDLNKSSATVGEADVVRPEDNLGASNIGNQMLQKLGWKTGSSLGRGVDGTRDGAQNTLVKDWEKIETLAASGQQGRMQRDSRERGIGN